MIQVLLYGKGEGNREGEGKGEGNREGEGKGRREE